jgi:hypothetical protein
MAQTCENILLNKILYKKITKTADWIKRKITHRIKPEKATPELTQKELLSVSNNFAFKSINRFKNTRRIDLYKNILNITKKGEDQTYSLFQKNISDGHTTSNMNLKLYDTKKMNKKSNHIIYKTLCNYRQNAGPTLYAPKESIIKLMCDWGMINIISRKPIPNKMLFKYHDLSIILYYKNKATSILEYYKPAKNFYWIKKQIDHSMRQSLLFTLAKKHKTSTSTIIQTIGKNTNIYINNGDHKLTEVASFLTSTYIYNKKNNFNTTFNCLLNIKKRKEPSIQTSLPKTLCHECQIKDCKENHIKIHHVATLHKKISPNYVMGSIKTNTKKIHWTKVIECALHKKQISLCTRHHLAIHTGKLFLEDLKTYYKSFKLLNSHGLAVRL